MEKSFECGNLKQARRIAMFYCNYIIILFIRFDFYLVAAFCAGGEGRRSCFDGII